jgi:hypothetical protein
MPASGGEHPVPGVVPAAPASNDYEPGCPVGMTNKGLGLVMAGAAEDLYLGPQRSKINTCSTAGISSVKCMIYRLLNRATLYKLLKYISGTKKRFSGKDTPVKKYNGKVNE